MQNKGTTISGKEYKKIIEHVKKLYPKNTTLHEDILSCSLIICDGNSDQIEYKKYQFIHPTFQEFFAAKKMKEYFLQTKSLSSEQKIYKELFCEHKYDEDYENIWRFTAGLLYQYYQDNSQKNKQSDIPLRKFWKSFLGESRDIIGLGEIVLVIRCLEECVADDSIDIHKKLLSDVAQWFEHMMEKEFTITEKVIYCNKTLSFSYFMRYLSESSNVNASKIFMLVYSRGRKIDKILQKIKELLGSSVHGEKYNAVSTMKSLLQAGIKNDLLDKLVESVLLNRISTDLRPELVRRNKISQEKIIEISALLNNNNNDWEMKTNAVDALGDFVEAGFKFPDFDVILNRIVSLLHESILLNGTQAYKVKMPQLSEISGNVKFKVFKAIAVCTLIDFFEVGFEFHDPIKLKKIAMRLLDDGNVSVKALTLTLIAVLMKRGFEFKSQQDIIKNTTTELLENSDTENKILTIDALGVFAEAGFKFPDFDYAINILIKAINVPITFDILLGKSVGFAIRILGKFAKANIISEKHINELMEILEDYICYNDPNNKYETVESIFSVFREFAQAGYKFPNFSTLGLVISLMIQYSYINHWVISGGAAHVLGKFAKAKYFLGKDRERTQNNSDNLNYYYKKRILLWSLNCPYFVHIRSLDSLLQQAGSSMEQLIINEEKVKYDLYSINVPYTKLRAAYALQELVKVGYTPSSSIVETAIKLLKDKRHSIIAVAISILGECTNKKFILPENTITQIIELFREPFKKTLEENLVVQATPLILQHFFEDVARNSSLLTTKIIKSIAQLYLYYPILLSFNIDNNTKNKTLCFQVDRKTYKIPIPELEWSRTKQKILEVFYQQAKENQLPFNYSLNQRGIFMLDNIAETESIQESQLNISDLPVINSKKELYSWNMLELMQKSGSLKDAIEPNKILNKKELNTALIAFEEDDEKKLVSVINNLNGTQQSNLGDMRDKHGNNLLHLSILKERLGCAKAIIKSSLIKVTEVNKYNMEPIHIAALMGQASMVVFLLNDYKLSNTKFPIHLPMIDKNVTCDVRCCAIFSRDEDTIKAILSSTLFKSDNNAQIPVLGSLLHIAVLSGDENVLKYLLEKYPSAINSKDEEGRTPLSLAAYIGDSSAIDILCNWKGVNIDEQGGKENENFSALHFAIIGKQGTKTVRKLLHYKIDLSLKCKYKGKEKDAEGLTKKLLKELEAECKEEAECKKDDKAQLKNIDKLLSNTSLHDKAKQYTFDEPNVEESVYRNLIFKGGAVKGIAYAGALMEIEAMYKNKGKDFFKSVHRVAGTSAGAITALLIALKYSPQDIADELKKVKNFSQLLEVDIKVLKEAVKTMVEMGEKVVIQVQNFQEESRFWKTVDAAKLLLKGGKTVYQNRSSMGEFFSLSAQFSKIQKFLMDKLNFKGFCEGEKIKEWIKKLVENKTKKKDITFKELKDMGFKDLYIVTTSLSPEQEIVVFNSEEKKWEDVSVVDAVRASMSIPFLFQPYEIEIKDEKGEKKKHKYIDGGLLKNYHLRLFDKLKYVNTYIQGDEDFPRFNRETLGFSLYDPPFLMKNDGIEKKIDEVKQSQEEQKKQLYELIKEMFSVYLNAEDLLSKLEGEGSEQSRTISISNHGISTIDFNLTEPQQQELMKEGEIGVKKFFKEEKEMKKYEVDNKIKLEEMKWTDNKENDFQKEVVLNISKPDRYLKKKDIYFVNESLICPANFGSIIKQEDTKNLAPSIGSQLRPPLFSSIMSGLQIIKSYFWKEIDQKVPENTDNSQKIFDHHERNDQENTFENKSSLSFVQPLNEVYSQLALGMTFWQIGKNVYEWWTEKNILNDREQKETLEKQREKKLLKYGKHPYGKIYYQLLWGYEPDLLDVENSRIEYLNKLEKDGQQKALVALLALQRLTKIEGQVDTVLSNELSTKTSLALLEWAGTARKWLSSKYEGERNYYFQEVKKYLKKLGKKTTNLQVDKSNKIVNIRIGKTINSMSVSKNNLLPGIKSQKIITNNCKLLMWSENNKTQESSKFISNLK